MSCVVATAGHVDHGKSSLVRALTGVDPDRLAEERRRGLTIVLGFAHTTLPSGAVVSFVDVPGHVRFLANMLSGVGGVRACLFVVDATEGWKAQTEEHLRILELVGVRHGVIALTKCDLVDDDEVESRSLEVVERTADSCLANAPIVPVSTVTGVGLDELRQQLDALIVTSPAAVDRGRPRVWIDRSFAARGSGTIVTGTLLDGSLTADDEVTIEPGTRTARIRAIESHSARFDQIGPGNRVALNLTGVSHHEVGRGDVVVTAGRWHVTDHFDAAFTVLASLGHDVSRRGAHLAYIGSAELAVRVRVVGAERLAPGATGAVRVFLPTALPLLPGDRFVLRESGRDETVGGGVILDVDPVRRVSQARPDDTIQRIIDERGWIDAAHLELLTGISVVPTVGRWAVSDEALAHARETLQTSFASAGAAGIDVAILTDRQRALLETLDVVVEGGRARRAHDVDPYVDHPLVVQLKAGGLSPLQPDQVDRLAVRELVRRNLVFERDRVLFHVDAIGAASRLVAELLAAEPEGFTVSAFRQRSGSTRKFAVPLLAELDARGITRRRGDLRIAGPRLEPN